jgi:hypothetical protein
MKNILDNILPTCDLILSQPVSDKYRGTDIFSSKVLREKKNQNAKHFIVSNCYFTGYDPVPFQTTDLDGGIIKVDGYSYFPSVCIESLIMGDKKKASRVWCDINANTNLE